MTYHTCITCGERFWGGWGAKYCVDCKDKRWAEQNHRADAKAYEKEKNSVRK